LRWWGDEQSCYDRLERLVTDGDLKRFIQREMYRMISRNTILGMIYYPYIILAPGIAPNISKLLF